MTGLIKKCLYKCHSKKQNLLEESNCFGFPLFSIFYTQKFFFYPLLKKIDGVHFSEQMFNGIPRSQI